VGFAEIYERDGELEGPPSRSPTPGESGGAGAATVSPPTTLALADVLRRGPEAEVGDRAARISARGLGAPE
jgi:hypothetical protein